MSPPMQPAKDDAEPKTVYGELGKVKLTAAEYANLQKKHAPSSLAAAIELLDGYIGQKKKDPYASHYAVLKDGSWVWERIAEKTRQGPRNKI